MQGVWWYLVGDSPQGPVSLETIEAMLHEGVMTQQSLIWKEGLSDWIAVAELSVLRQTHAVPAEAALLAQLAPAGAWRRFLARMVDIWFISIPIAMLVFGLMQTMPAFSLWYQRPASQILLTLGLFPLVLLVEAGIFAWLGTTPGKALLGVVVLTLDGQYPTAAQYLRRQLGVYWYGMAMGLPLLSLVVMAGHGLDLQRGEPASYDEKRFTVRARGWSRARVMVLAGITGTMAALGLARAYLGQ